MRSLAAIWACDVAMQLGMGELLNREALPEAVAPPLEAVLVGKVQRLLVGVALWLPYLLLSKRVDLTYRSKVPA